MIISNRMKWPLVPGQLDLRDRYSSGNFFIVNAALFKSKSESFGRSAMGNFIIMILSLEDKSFGKSADAVFQRP